MNTRSLLLPSSGSLSFLLAGDDLSQHDDTVAIHEGNPGQALAILEGVANKRLPRLKTALCHLVGLERVRILHLLTASLLAHLPLELGDAAGGPSTSHKTDGGVTDF